MKGHCEPIRYASHRVRGILVLEASVKVYRSPWCFLWQNWLIYFERKDECVKAHLDPKSW